LKSDSHFHPRQAICNLKVEPSIQRALLLNRRLEGCAQISELKVHLSTLYKLVRKGQIPAFKIGVDYRFDRDEIEKWITDRQVKR